MASVIGKNDGKTRIRSLLLLLSVLVMLTSSLVMAPAALAAAPRAGSVASVLGGSMHFGGYSVDTDKLALAAQMGMNTVAEVPMSVNEYLPYLAAAEALGLKVRVSISPSFLGYPDDRIIRYLQPLVGSDAISMWYLPEEPKTAEDHQKWGRLYNIIKANDPKGRPIGLYLAGSVTPDYFRYWSQVTDVIFCGAYPELYDIERVSIVTRIKGAVEGTAGTGTTVIATPQFMDAQTYMQVKGLSTLPSGFHFGYPSEQYMRFDAFIPLMLGAQGLDWYTTLYGFLKPELVDGLSNVLRQLNEMSPILAASDPPMQGLSYQILAGPTQSLAGKGVRHESIYMTTRHYRGHQYLFVASLVADPVTVQFFAPPGSDMTGYSMDVLYEGRSLPIAGGTVTDQFNDFDIHIYKIVPAPAAGKQLVH